MGKKRVEAESLPESVEVKNPFPELALDGRFVSDLRDCIRIKADEQISQVIASQFDIDRSFRGTSVNDYFLEDGAIISCSVLSTNSPMFAEVEAMNTEQGVIRRPKDHLGFWVGVVLIDLIFGVSSLDSSLNGVFSR